MKRLEKEKENQLNGYLKLNNSLSSEDKVFLASNLIDEVENVNIEEAFAKVQNRISTTGKLVQLYKIISRYAAILIVPLLSITIWLLVNKNEETKSELAMQEITCPIGMRSQISLPDGSKVWLNSESTIKYSLPFVRNKRVVELDGQAFLNVTKNEDSPFSIQSGNIKVDVVGTQFDFKSYPDDDFVEVTLKEGRINLELLSGIGTSTNTSLIPGDHFVYNKISNEAYIENQDIDNYLGWIDNKLILDETPILEMKKILERWYGVKIEIMDETIETYKFTTTFENESLYQVLELLELSSPIKMEYIHSRIDKKTNKVIKSKIKISNKP